MKAVISEAVREAVKSELATEFGTMLREILEITSQDKEDAIADALERAGVAGSDWEEEENGSGLDKSARGKSGEEEEGEGAKEGKGPEGPADMDTAE